MNKKTFYKCLVAVGLIVLFLFSDSIGVELNISDLLGGLLC